MNIDKKKEMIEMRSTVGNWGHLDERRLQRVRHFSGNKVLDVGCSTGLYVKKLISENYDAFGCDILSDIAWHGAYKNKFKVASVYKLPYKNNEFDSVLLFEVLEHIVDPGKALKELRRVTNGNVLISVPYCFEEDVFPASGLSYHHWIDRTHVNFFTEKSITKLLGENGFKIDYLERITPVMPETLVMYSFHVPLKIASFLGKAFQIIPFRRKFNMCVLVVASKK